MLDMKKDGDVKPSIKPTTKKLVGGLAFMVLFPIIFSGMLNIDLVNACRYEYTYNNTDEDSFRNFLGIQLVEPDPNPYCIKQTETGDPDNPIRTCYSTASPNGGNCPGDLKINPLDKIISPIFLALQAFELVLGTVVFIGAGIPMIKYKLV